MVAGGEGFAEVGREDPGGVADVQDAALAAEEDGDDVGVAGDFADGGGGDGAGEGERPGAGGGSGERGLAGVGGGCGCSVWCRAWVVVRGRPVGAGVLRFGFPCSGALPVGVGAVAGGCAGPGCGCRV